MKTHLTWTEEVTPGICPHCGAKTMFVIADRAWRAAEGEDLEGTHDCDDVDTNAEVSGHVCRECGELTSLSLNKIQRTKA